MNIHFIILISKFMLTKKSRTILRICSDNYKHDKLVFSAVVTEFIAS